MTAFRSHTDIFLRAPGARLTTAAQAAAFSLTHVVEAAVRNIDPNAIKPLPRHDGFVGDARRLLAVLTWSYARGLYNTTQIQAWASGKETADLWECGPPDASEIRRFRGENRSALQFCLQAALRSLATQKLADGLVTRLDDANLSAEAARRIVTSMFVDSNESIPPVSPSLLARC